MVTERLLRVAIPLVAVVALGACSSPASGPTPNSTSATTSALASPDANPYGSPPPVDPPGPNDTILTVSGGTAGELTYTLSQLEAVGSLQTVTIYEPFAKEKQTFKAIALKDLLNAAGITDSQYIDTLALNDYKYDALAGNLTSSDGLIATELNGSPIPIDRGGPIRLIFKDGTPYSANLDAWNWSLVHISVTTSPSPSAA